MSTSSVDKKSSALNHSSLVIKVKDVELPEATEWVQRVGRDNKIHFVRLDKQRSPAMSPHPTDKQDF